MVDAMKARLRMDERDLLARELSLEVSMTVAEWLRLAEAVAGEAPGYGIRARFYLTIMGSLRGLHAAVNREHVHTPVGGEPMARGRGAEEVA